MTGHGNADDSDERNSHIGQNTRDSKPENFLVKYIHFLSSSIMPRYEV